MRGLPDNITINNFGAYQVRIRRGETEYLASFSESAYGGKDEALAAAVSWRDKMLACLPPATNGKGSFRRAPMAHKQSFGRVGITRYVKRDHRRTGSPEYLVFGVNWTDSEGYPRVKQFQAGRIGVLSWKDELHAAQTALAFRTEWEFCRDHKVPFDPERYRDWTVPLYPFMSTTPEGLDESEGEALGVA